jgi:hypothetical protein
MYLKKNNILKFLLCDKKVGRRGILLNTFTVSEAPPQHVLERRVPGNKDLAALQFAELNSILADALTKHKKQL